MAIIDPRAVVSPKAELAADVQVGAFAIIGDDVTIGPGTVIAPHAVVNGPTTMGADNRVFQFASLGDAPQDKKYRGEPTRLSVGDRNTFREFCTVNRGTVSGHGVTRVGSDNMLLSYSHVAHDCILGDNIVLSNLVQLGGHVEVGDWVTMAGYAGVHQFVKIGAHAFVGNMTAVSRDVPPYVLTHGQPAVPHSINSVGLQRRGFTAEQVRNIKNAYRILYRSDLKLDVAVERLEALAKEQPELRIFVDFIGTATRSLIR